MTNKVLPYIQNLTDAWNSYDLERVLPYYSEEYEAVDISELQVQRGREAVREMLGRYWKAFTDLRFRVTGPVAEGDRIAISWSAEGTHRGPIMNIPPTGHKVAIRGVSIIDVKDGLVTRAQYIWDLAGMLRHMGLLPEL